MFVGVVVENFHKCRESQEQEEKARRAAVHARKIDRKRKRSLRHVMLCSVTSYCVCLLDSGPASQCAAMEHLLPELPKAAFPNSTNTSFWGGRAYG